MAELKSILSNPKYSRFVATLDSPDFSSLRSLVAKSKLADLSVNPNIHFLGSSIDNKNDLRIQRSDVVEKLKLDLKRTFQGFLGGIGPQGTFPYIFEMPNLKLLSDKEKKDIWGDKADYIKNTQENENTLISIGDHFNNVSFNPDFVSNFKFRIFIGDLVSKDRYINFPRLQFLDADRVVTHNQSDKKVIEIKNNAVYVYPGEYKRCLSIRTCSSGLKNLDRGDYFNGELKGVSDTGWGPCSRNAASLLKVFIEYEDSGFSGLVRVRGEDAEERESIISTGLEKIVKSLVTGAANGEENLANVIFSSAYTASVWPFALKSANIQNKNEFIDDLKSLYGWKAGTIAQEIARGNRNQLKLDWYYLLVSSTLNPHRNGAAFFQRYPQLRYQFGSFWWAGVSSRFSSDPLGSFLIDSVKFNSLTNSFTVNSLFLDMSSKILPVKTQQRVLKTLSDGAILLNHGFDFCGNRINDEWYENNYQDDPSAQANLARSNPELASYIPNYF